jgi:plastocyanin
MKKAFAFTVAAVLAGSVTIAHAGDISGTVMLKGTPPKEKDITPLKDDATCGKLHAEMPTTHFYVVGPKGELADVIVFVEGAPKGAAPSSSPVVLDQKGCEYSPSIFAVQTGQKIVVKNSDPVLHNVHFDPASSGNKEFNQAQLAGGPELTFVIDKPGEFLKFKCDVHPWMFAWATVLPDPYFAVSAKDGSFKITGLPPGKYKVHAAHRKAGTVTQEVEVKGDGAAKADFVLEAK